MGNTGDTLVVRADADVPTGTGHVMRSLALAQTWDGPVRFATAAMPDGLAQRIAGEKMMIDRIDGSAAVTLDLAARHGARWVVVDGYQFDGEYEQALHDTGLRVLAWDDHEHTAHRADLVLNQNIDAHQRRYGRDGVLAGTRYACLRREFWAYRDWRRAVGNGTMRVLVTLGGSDPHGLLPRVLNALANAGLEITAVVGAATARCEALGAAANAANARVITDAPDMARLMADADLAIAAAGSTSWELLFMQLPALVITVAENQRGIASGLDAAGAAEALGWWRELDDAQLRERTLALAADVACRRRIGELGRQLVDGHGGTRVVTAMREAA